MRKALNTHDRAAKARLRVLKHARKKGYVTNEKARKLGKFDQVWYHLKVLSDRGLLKHQGHNRWVPIPQRGRPRLSV
jgi:hypothetical protein